MLNDFINKLLHENFKFTPTEGQDKLLKILSQFISDNNKNNLLLIKGYAGTGKTTIIKTLVKTLNVLKQKSLLLAPTGRAAKIMETYTNSSAFTIHKKIYKIEKVNAGFGKFKLATNLYTNTYFIIDEASMIGDKSFENSAFGSGNLLGDLITFVKQGKDCKLILIGDTAQLPPVGLDLSPALDGYNLETFGFKVTEIELTEVIRQSQKSGILHNATYLRNIFNNTEFEMPKLVSNNFSDVKFITGEDLIDTINDSYDKYGINDTIVVTRSNKRANIYNQGIRNKIFWYEDLISVGDYIMIVKNNYNWLDDEAKINFIANGDIARIDKIRKYYTRYNMRFADVKITLVDYDIELDTRILLDTLTSETASLSSEQNKEFFYAVLEDYNYIKTKAKRYKAVREDGFFSALQIKFAYAVTCHKAQGGQWKSVFIDHGYLTDDRINKEFIRWLYTAVTRASEKIYFVNFNKAFIEENN